MNPAESSLQNNRLLIVGAAHVDDIAKSVDPIVPCASNAVTWQRRLGGVSANAARAAARTVGLGTSVAFSAAVGDDSIARQIEHTLQSCAVEPHLVFLHGIRTGRYSAIMDADGELHVGLSDVLVAEKLDLNTLQNSVDLSNVDALLIDANLSPDCLTALAQYSIEHGIPLATMSVSPAKSQRLLPLAAAVQLLFCNRREAIALCPNLSMNDPIEALADALLDLGFNQLVLTDGQSPLLIHSDTGRETISVPTIEQPQNVNGAGDALAGATFAAWAGGLSLVDATTLKGLVEAEKVVRGTLSAPELDPS